MKARFLTALHNVSIHGSFGRGFRLSDTRFLTNDRSVVANLLTPPLELCAGQLEINALKTAPAVFYSIETLEDSKDLIETSTTRIDDHLRFLQALLMCMWLVRDNAANFELGFFEYPYPSRNAQVTSNFRSIRFTAATGPSTETVSFGRPELDAARDFLHNTFGAHRDTWAPLKPEPTIPENVNRLTRTWYFAQAARNTNDLGIKLSSYMTCFESLFTTDSQELAHKLSERVAVFLGSQFEERKSVYHTLKEAYSVRSKIVHGDRLNQKQISRVKEVSVACDDLLRRSIRKILGTEVLLNLFSGPSAPLDAYFLDAIFARGDERDATLTE